MAEHSKLPAPTAAAPADPRLIELPPQPPAEQSESPDADAVKGGLGINRIVVTDGQIKG